MRLFLTYITCFIVILSCKRPYGQDEMVSEHLPDSIVYPVLDEVQDNEDHFQNYRLAKYTFNKGNTSKALAYAKRAVELDDQNALYYYLLAQIHASLNQPDEALDNALKSYSLGYVNPEMQILISEQYYANEQYNKGRKFLDVAVKKRPDDPVVTFLKAKSLLQQDNDTVAALKWIDKTLAIDSTFTEALERKAEIFIADSHEEEALFIREKIFQAEPQNISNLYALGTLNMELANITKAAYWFEQILMLEEDHLSSYLQLSEINFQQRQYDSVRYYAGMALKYDSAFNDARLLIARSYDRQYRYSDALNAYQGIVSRDSTFEIAIIEMEQLLKKIAYLRRRRVEQDTARSQNPAPVDSTNNSNNQND